MPTRSAWIPASAWTSGHCDGKLLGSLADFSGERNRMLRLTTLTILLLLLSVAGSTSSCASITARAGMFGPPADLYPGVYKILAEAQALDELTFELELRLVNRRLRPGSLLKPGTP